MFSTCESVPFENCISGDQGSGCLKLAFFYPAGLTAESTSGLQQYKGLLIEATTVVPSVSRI